MISKTSKIFRKCNYRDLISARGMAREIRKCSEPLKAIQSNIYLVDKKGYGVLSMSAMVVGEEYRVE